MITFTPYGATGEVTGCAYLVETQHSTILVDCGMFQDNKGDDSKNVIPDKIHRINVMACLPVYSEKLKVS